MCFRQTTRSGAPTAYRGSPTELAAVLPYEAAAHPACRRGTFGLLTTLGNVEGRAGLETAWASAREDVMSAYGLREDDLWMRVETGGSAESGTVRIVFTKLVYVWTCMFVREEMARERGGVDAEAIDAFVFAVCSAKKEGQSRLIGRLANFETFSRNWHLFRSAFSVQERISKIADQSGQPLTAGAAEGLLMRIFPKAGTTRNTAGSNVYRLGVSAQSVAFSPAVERAYSAALGKELDSWRKKRGRKRARARSGAPSAPSLARFVIDQSAELDRHRDLVPRPHLRTLLDSFLASRESGYLVIEGGPGTGKTAFVVDLVRNSDDRPVVYHLVQRGMGNWDEPGAFLTSLYVQLLEKHHLPEPEATRDLRPAAKLLALLGKISATLSGGARQVIYLDGLDEAFGVTGAYAQLWPGILPRRMPRGIFAVLTSRPGRHLDLLADPEACTRVSIEQYSSENSEDIRRYIEARNRSLSLGVCRALIDAAVSRAGMSFLYASCVVRDLRRQPPGQRTVVRVPEGLECWLRSEWTRALWHCGHRAPSEPRVLDVAAFLLAAFEPLTWEQLDELVGPEEDCVEAVLHLSEFLEPAPRTAIQQKLLRFSHEVFEDFFRGEVGAARMAQAHLRLAKGCARWRDVVSRSARSYALTYRVRHLLAGRSWHEAGRACCSPSFVQERVRRGTYGSFLTDLECCTVHDAIPEATRCAFALLHGFFQKRSRHFMERPEAVGQELMNDLKATARGPLAGWVSQAVGTAGPWLRKIAGPSPLSSGAHAGPVTACRFSPDGRHIVSGATDGSIRLWDATDLGSLFVGSRHSACINSIAYARDGSRFASGSSDGTVMIWDPKTGTCLAVGNQRDSRILSVAFSFSGRKVASGSSSGDVLVWDAETGECLEILTGHRSSVARVAFSPTGDLLASAGWDGTIRIWHCGRTLAVSRRASSSQIAVAFLPCHGRTRLLSVGLSGTVDTWELSGSSPPTLGLVSTFDLGGAGLRDGKGCYREPDSIPEELWIFDSAREAPITGASLFRFGVVAFLPRTRCFVIGGLRGSLDIWYERSRESRELAEWHDPPIASVAASPDSALLAIGESNGRLSVWNVEGKAYVAGARTQRSGQWSRHPGDLQPPAAAIANDGLAWALAADRLTVGVSGLEVEPHVLSNHGGASRAAPSCVAFAPAGHPLVCGMSDGRLEVWDLRPEQLTAMWHAHSEKVTAVAFSPDGTRIASIAGLMQLSVWDVQTQERAFRWEPSSTGEGLAVSPKEYPRLWDVDWPGELDSWGGVVQRTAPALVSGISFSPDGSRLAIGTWQGSVLLLGLQADRAREESSVTHAGGVTAVVWSPDGRTIMSSDDSGLLCVWDATTGGCLRSYQVSSGGIQTLAFSRDASVVAIGGQDGKVEFRDAETHTALAVLFLATRPLALAFSDDNRRIAVVDDEGRYFCYEPIGF